jgi:predicted MFS family arabinose efflux permease
LQFATLTVLVFGLGNFFGMILGGAGGMALYRRDKRYPAILAGASAIMGCFPFWILLNHVNASSSFITIGVVAVSTGLASGVAGPIIKATLQNVTFPQSRGQAFALFNTFDDFGRGLGPVFVASLITRVGGRTQAFNIGVLGWVFCGFFNLIVFFTVERDERNLQTAIAASLSKAPAEQITSVGLDYASQDSDGYAPGSRRRNIV